jgi:hypothetical protein
MRNLQGTRGPRPGFYLALGVFAWLLSACGMFQIRDAVAPSTGGGIPEEAPISPENVLFNFSSAVSHKLNGLVLYERCLADSFVLVLDQVDFLELPGLGSPELNKTVDVAAHQRVVTDFPDSISFGFGTAPKEEGSTTAFFQDIPYEMSFLSRVDGDWVPIDSLRVAGTIKLTLVKGEDATWSIRSWIDQRVEGATSFGRLHADKALAAPRPGNVLD